MQPTFRNLTDSFESWAYRNGFHRQLAELERQKFLERKRGALDGRIFRLTAPGRLRALGGRDPAAEWNRAWDGRWRLVIFDLPTGEERVRSRLRRYLREKGFGYLQNSVWITPNPPGREMRTLGGRKTNVESFVLLEARPCAGESDADIVAGAWDFDRINQLYSEHLEILRKRPKGRLDSMMRANALRSWADHERLAWKEAIARDPLLPKALLPSGYKGRKAWERRVKVLAQASRDLRSFSLTNQ